ncbi:plasmid replication protein, CyRepA1 family [Modicisalibacter xianhensis]|uniref:Putative DNA primase/helicase n=1 Tax=Modicisalibacter xianhensis TaxID=442341 RepID=A0A1I3GBM6_9GAMM|nr:plasmid replication protein, CyRepA1 family [Halomonas xianhensis]SFI20814.1 putative DNA primase/helicase [Halomonas xianhensis]
MNSSIRNNIDFTSLIEPVARELLGDPTKANARELRYGSKGSVVVRPDKGNFSDFSTGVNGGVLALIAYITGIGDVSGQMAWLADHGFIENHENHQNAYISPGQRERERQHRESEKSRKHAEQLQQRVAEQAEGERRAQRMWVRGTPAPADHPYLISKGIDPTGLGLRVNWLGELLIPVCAPESGTMVNLQRIAPDGTKRFIKGARKKGCYSLLPGTGGRVFSEGYATGWTVWKATGRPVIVAWDASNIGDVIAHLGRQPGDAVAADNDGRAKPGAPFRKRLSEYGTGHKAAIKTGLPFYLPPVPGADFNDMGIEATAAIFGREPVSNTPVLDAWNLQRVELPGKKAKQWINALARTTEPEKAAALAYSVAAKLAPRAPAQMSLATIRQTIEASLPESAIHPATLDRIMQRLEIAQGHRKRAALAPVTLPADIAAHHNYERRAELPELASDAYRGVIVVKAPMGSGKTQRIGRPLARWARENGERLLAICHRRSLTAELAERLELPHYGDLDATSAWGADGLATCLPSITLPSHAALIDNAGAVFIDEVAQVLRFLQAAKHCRTQWADNRGVYERLREVVSNARCVIVADAGADRRTIEFLESCRPGERFRIIEVPEPHSTKIEATYSYGQNAPAQASGHALAELAAGGKVWIATESKRRAKALGKMLKDAGYRVLVVHSGNSGNKDQRKFLDSAEAESLRYDAVIASPVIGSGLSIEHRDVPDHERFTLGLYIGGGHRTPPADAAQQLRRVRYLKRFSLALVPNSTAAGNQCPDAILKAAEQAAQVEGSASKATDFDALVADIRADYDNTRADFAAGLLWQLDAAGWSLKADTEAADPEIAGALQAAAAAVDDSHRQALMAAPILSDEDAARLERLSDRNEMQNATLEAHRLRRALGIAEEPITEDILDFWDDGRAVARLDRFSAWQGIVPDNDDASLPITSRRYLRACAKAYSWLFEGTGLDQWGLTVETANVLLDRIMQHRHLLAHLGIVSRKYAQWREDKEGNPLPMKRPAYPVREVTDMLERLGLVVESKKRRCGTSPLTPLGNNTPCATPEGSEKPAKKAKGNPIIRVYQPAPASIQAMTQWAESRNAARKVAEMEAPASEPAQQGEPEPGTLLWSVRQARRCLAAVWDKPMRPMRPRIASGGDWQPPL